MKHEQLSLKIEDRPVGDLCPAKRALRKHTPKQVAQLQASIERFGLVNPILLGPKDEVVAGQGRLEAAKAMGMSMVPTIRLAHMTPEERRAYAIADNRLAELSEWDEPLLSLELQELEILDLDFDIEITGFDGAVLDRLLDGVVEDEEDEIPDVAAEAVSRLGDTWVMGSHRLSCGSARDAAVFDALMGAERARMVFTDPPYNVKIKGFVSGKGARVHREFVEGAGELNPAEFTSFLTETLGHAAAYSIDGSIHFVCMDWRHQSELTAAAETVYEEQKNLCVWNKHNAGMGAFYRSQHELVGVYKKGTAPHLNTFGLGRSGRYRTNVWTYPGATGFGANRMRDLEQHPTAKPVALVADAIRDVSRRGDIVLDPFAGSGSTLLAAERTRRKARLIELDPLYCDVVCRRWRAVIGSSAVLEADGRAFEEVMAARRGDKMERADG